MRNLEAKFPLRDPQAARRAAEKIGYACRAVIRQHDTFFWVAHGKLKLREQSDGAWLIHYQRDSVGELQLSRYEIVPLAQGEATRRMLAKALGVLAEIRKTRVLMMREKIRLHLDALEGLGNFGEIEAVLAEDDTPAQSRAAVEETLAALGIEQSDLIEQSYFELLAAKGAG